MSGIHRHRRNSQAKGIALRKSSNGQSDRHLNFDQKLSPVFDKIRQELEWQDFLNGLKPEEREYYLKNKEALLRK